MQGIPHDLPTTPCEEFHLVLLDLHSGTADPDAGTEVRRPAAMYESPALAFTRPSPQSMSSLPQLNLLRRVVDR